MRNEPGAVTDELQGIEEARAQWVDERYTPAAAEARQLPPGRLPLYTPVETANIDYASQLGVPGSFPFTRGAYDRMYLDRPWVMRQIVGYGTPDETNERFRYLLANGETGLTAVFDQPTVMGLDSDDPLARGEVGRSGVPVDSVDDMARMFADMPIDRVHVALLASYGSAPAIFACYLAMAEEAGYDLASMPGSIQNHLIPFYIALPKCCYIPPRAAFRCVSDAFEFCTRRMPRFTPINITAHIIRESGATNVQELALCLAIGAAHVEHAIARGLDVDSFGPKLAFYFSASTNFFEEVAKYRAARRMWARIMRDEFGAKDVRSQQLRFHAQVSAFTTTVQEPRNNIMRGTFEALAAALGGAQSVNVTPYDEALNIPTEESVLLALRTNQIIYHESDVAGAIDPLGGSYYVENLTDELEARATDELARIRELGGSYVDGIVYGIESGLFVQEVTEELHRREQAVEDGSKVVVGLNRFRAESAAVDVFDVPPELEKKQVERLARIRAERSPAAVSRTLDGVRAAASQGTNIIESMIEAAKARATVGEMTQALIDVFGSYRAKTAF
jgi:methylmalonyl-CoA mutase N-terminal domain/subunit